jgi:hypothetical protein
MRKKYIKNLIKKTKKYKNKKLLNFSNNNKYWVIYNILLNIKRISKFLKP